jgi:hypothetical protein
VVYCDKFKFYSVGLFLDFRKEKPSYQVINWRPPEDQEKKFADLRHRLTEEITYGR